ncbi:molybdenum ABC transporter ATP-binding protein [Extensimonas vulgaris]|uniref:Molybdate transport system ATP-binding protein n=1 Tax=Extensimonas vulgaris TaxID=1031594 RepID=A0A369AL48_9BURK|nr:molybdenum ABC transporter ATP-binding protein [Extensimonas vulgaris]RCX10119.1 molybdate transport system ATP-binding protein [Extensimonas vulgaris]TWI39700.1 molybdate transport system ATP-binding protein [Extensimonas vulgaris]
MPAEGIAVHAQGAASEADRARDGIEARFAIAYPGFTLHADLHLPGRGVTALFGASGSGKTSLLRAIAGLERHAGGHLAVNGAVWQDAQRFVPTHRRPLGYVFQEASLFAHLDVARNLDYGLRRIPAAARRVPRAQAIELLGIGHLLRRRPDTLSGGERQRVAIARALLTAPRLLLMDEPLAALDAQRKAEILPYLARLRAELDIPVLYVSHALDEVIQLADHLVLLGGGRATGQVLASGPIAETLARIDLPTAQSASAAVLIEATVQDYDSAYELLRLGFAGGELLAPHPTPLAPGTRLRLQVQARDVSLALAPAPGSSILNRLPATVTGLCSADTPAHTLVRLDAGGTPLLARITRFSCDQLHLTVGMPVWAQIKAVALLG